MSYAMAAALQEAVYQTLIEDPETVDLVGHAIYDTVPPGEVPGLYVSLGPEDVRNASEKTGLGADHRFVVSVVSSTAGFHRAKMAAAAISDALETAEFVLSRGRLVGMWFDRATARRAGKAGRIRQIDLRFRARVEDL